MAIKKILKVTAIIVLTFVAYAAYVLWKGRPKPIYSLFDERDKLCAQPVHIRGEVRELDSHNSMYKLSDSPERFNAIAVQPSKPGDLPSIGQNLDVWGTLLCDRSFPIGIAEAKRLPTPRK